MKVLDNLGNMKSSYSLPAPTGGPVTDGQLLIGKTSDRSLNLATLTASTGISVTNGAGSITLTNTGVLPRGYIDGLTLSYSSTTVFGIAAGVCRDSTNAYDQSLSSAYTKTTAAWAVGSGNGGLDTGAIASSTWYHVYVIKRSDTGVVDVLFSTSASSPTMPTNYDSKRRIGSVLTDGSSHFVSFSQLGDEFLWAAPVAVSGTASTTAGNVVLSTPLGVQCWAIITSFFGGSIVYLSATDQNDEAASASVWTDQGAAGPGTPFNIRTNTSSQIRVRANGAGISFNFRTAGWIDQRGKNA